MVSMLDTEEVDDYTVICKQKNAHNRGLVGVWAFRAGNGIVGLVTVGHDSVKLWRMDETVSGVVTLTSKVEIKEWRAAVQSADVTCDGKCICIVTVDSMFYEIILGDDGPVVMTHDFGVMEAWHVRIAKSKTNYITSICIVTVDSMFYEIILGDDGPVVMTHDFGVMEAWHVRIAKSKTNYITTAFSGFLKEIDLNGKIARQEPFQYAKSVGAISYGSSNKRLAVSTFEGILHILEVATLKSETTIEAHSKRIRALAFLPGDDEILTGSDDKTIKLHSVSGERPKVERVYCGHRSPVLSLAVDDCADGTRFASSSLDGQILLWHIEQPSALQQLPSPHSGAVTTVVFVPTGRHLVSGGEDGMVACYRIPQAGMLSPGHIHQNNENIGYLDQQFENEAFQMDHENVH
ncbi:WD domain, G-beta repeat protein [Dictyocaulus viviparus]|uniref:WD domain, G-beta repeat protein n=1 Tax=Dictyocaulus viviparus TaxID=29172 RepID=A0A0D8YAX6_DICVI|nr:WD domain, G-beta repeat protein [Dictyocaulus viviparus]